MKNKTIKSKDIDALNVIHYKGRTIYYNFVNKTGYVIDDESAGRFQFYKHRFFICLAICFTMMCFTKNYPLCFVSSLFLFIVISVLFYKAYLPKLQIYDVSAIIGGSNIFERISSSTTFNEFFIYFVCLSNAGISVLTNTSRGAAKGSTVVNYAIGGLFLTAGAITLVLIICKLLKRKR